MATTAPRPISQRHGVEAPSIYDEGHWVWAPEKERVWIPAKVLELTGEKGEKGSVLKVSDPETGRTLTFKGSKSDLEAVVPSTVKHVQNNLCDLEDFNEGTILHQIAARYREKLIYTYVGSILVSMNPFKYLDEYLPTPAHIDEYRLARGAMPPHIFDIARRRSSHYFFHVFILYCISSMLTFCCASASRLHDRAGSRTRA